MRLTFQADRHQNVYHSLQEVKDFKQANWVFEQVDSLTGSLRGGDETQDDWARTLPGKVIMDDSNLLSPYGVRHVQAELDFDAAKGTSTLVAELFPDDRKKSNVKLHVSQQGDDRSIYHSEGGKSLRLEQNTRTGVFTIIDE